MSLTQTANGYPPRDFQNGVSRQEAIARRVFQQPLKLDTDLGGGERNLLLKYSAIEPDQIENWIVASGAVDQSYRSWSRERALAFQRAVEERATHLYQNYYDILGFSKWR